MKFSEIIDRMKSGEMFTRYGVDSFVGKFIVAQVASDIPKEVVPKMTSLPEFAKQHIGTVGHGGINYHDQVLIVSCADGRTTTATSYTPTWEDIFAEDWEVV